MNATPDLPVSVEDKDAERLSPYLTNWNKLSPFLGSVNEADLTRLILLECAGKKREMILDRLLARLGKLTRKRLAQTVKHLLHD